MENSVIVFFLYTVDSNQLLLLLLMTIMFIMTVHYRYNKTES